MKGIVLAGGRGGRLYPMTLTHVKPLLPVYNKPMIYYPFSNLLSFGIREIAIISQEENLPHYKALFGNGSRFGVKIEYLVQKELLGIADSFRIADKFIDCPKNYAEKRNMTILNESLLLSLENK